MKLVKRVVRAIFVTFVSLVLVPATIVGILFLGFVVLPLPASLPEPRALPVSAPTEVFDSQGNLLATFRPYEQSFPVSQSDIPEVLKQAVISAEDQRFYEHGGIDPKGITRALVADLRGQQRQGGSTITQQYVKNAYTGSERTIARKVREAVLASQLDRQVDKEEILFRYLSTIYLGNGIYGVGAASEAYFRKPVNELTVSESATIAGIIPAPSRREPRGNPKNAESNRKVVLGKMLAQGRISQEQYNEAIGQVVWLESQGPSAVPVTVIYPAKQEQFSHPYFVDYVRRYLTTKYGQAAVYGGGLKVVTTLDPVAQVAAEESVNNAIGKYDAPLEMALASVEPQTGYVKALVGGRDFGASSVNLALGGCPTERADRVVEVKPTCWGEDTITGGGTGRQPGSAFKPFVLATAFSQGMSPSKTYNAPGRFYPPGCKRESCSIGNASDGEGGGSLTLRQATVGSVNTVYAQLVRDVGFENTANTAKSMGLQSIYWSSEFQGTSGNFALGTTEVAPLDMAAAYGVFANRGIRQEATPIITVIDANNNVIEDNTNRNGVRVLEEIVADNVTDVLRGVVSGGTGRRANIGRPAAGKTGTTNDYKDAWFVGYTPTLSTAVWMGYSDKPRTMRLKGVGNVFGGSISAPTWGAYMKRALADVPVTDFSDPAPIKKLTSKQAKQVAIDSSAALEAADSAGGDVTVAPGRQQQIPGTDPGSYDEGANAPSVNPPTRVTPTTTSTPQLVIDPGTTSTTQPAPPETTTTTASP